MGKAVGSGGEHVGDAWVHLFIITRVGGKLLGEDVWTNNVEQIVSESEHLKDKKKS